MMNDTAKKRLIDVNALFQSIVFAEFDTLTDRLFINEMLRSAPTVDAVEVVHGRWIKDGESIYCSACGFETSSLLPYVCDGEKWVPCYANRYCGNCGAKMDGGK